jgi:hypothetical protein
MANGYVSQMKAARAQLDHQVRMARRVEASKQARSLVDGIVRQASMMRRYRDSGGSGLASYTQTLDAMEVTLRRKRKALARHVIRMEGSGRRAIQWGRVLGSTFAEVTEVPQQQCLRWISRLEHGR